jgi:hypothetical protein
MIILQQQQQSKTLVNALQKGMTDNLIPPYLTINEQVMNKRLVLLLVAYYYYYYYYYYHHGTS